MSLLQPPKVQTGPLLLDGFIKVRRDRLTTPDTEHSFDYYVMLLRSPCVVILAFDTEGFLILNEEYRHPTGQVLLCTSGGYLEKDEDPIDGAKRELLEECGYEAEEAYLMAQAYPYPGISDQKAYFVVVPRAKKSAGPQRELSEMIRTCLIPLKEVQRRLLNDSNCDGMLSSALYYYTIWNDGMRLKQAEDFSPSAL